MVQTGCRTWRDDVYRWQGGVVAGSIYFSKMDQAGFEQFYNRAVDILIDGLLPKVDKNNLKARIDDIIMGAAA